MPIDYHDLTAIQDTLKEVYGSGLQNQFADEQLTYHQFPKSERKPRGLGYNFGIRVARAQGVGARGESEIMPDPLAGKYDQGKVLPKYMYGVLRMTGPAIEGAKSDVAAFVDGLSDAVNDIYESLVNDMNRQACGDGFGLLATMSEASDTVTVSGTTTWTVTCDNALGVSRLVPGMIVNFYAGANINQSAVASRIASVNYQNKTCEMEPNDGTYKANHPIVAARAYTIGTTAVSTAGNIVRIGARAASHATSNTPKEITGLEGIYDDGTLLATFENVLVATHPEWKANVLGNSSVDRELTVDLMLQSLDVIRTRGGKKGQMMRMGLGQRRKYANLLLPDVRFQPGKLEGGYETLTFAAGDGSVKIVVNPALPPSKIFVEPAGIIQKYEMTELGWGNLDQQMHWRNGYDEWDQFLRLYTNLGCEQRNCLCLIKDLAEPGLYD